MQQSDNTNASRASNELDGEGLGKRADLVDEASNKSVDGSVPDESEKPKKTIVTVSSGANTLPEMINPHDSTLTEKLIEKSPDEHNGHESELKSEPQRKLKDLMKERLEKAPSMIIDCDFAKVQNDKEVASMVVQISECIHLNKRSLKPINIHLTGLHDKLFERLTKQ